MSAYKAITEADAGVQTVNSIGLLNEFDCVADRMAQWNGELSRCGGENSHQSAATTTLVRVLPESKCQVAETLCDRLEGHGLVVRESVLLQENAWGPHGSWIHGTRKNHPQTILEHF